ncbi:MAG: tyrosine-type recombinase/integrase [Gammaproteobacteria bacterium]|nr:tyrosine-type recombinase/integrase [Gammaproteobacteria bacterium]
MRIHATINERTLRRTFREKKPGRHDLTIIDRDLPRFGFTVARNGTKTFFVRTLRPVRGPKMILGTAGELTAAEARKKAAAAIAAAQCERETGPLFADFAEEFMRRRAHRWKLSTRQSNRHLLERYLVPFFGAMHVARIGRADVRRWFDSLSGSPGSANRTLPVLSVMLRQAELWGFRPQGSNPCRNMRRYKTTPRERFLSLDELKRLGFVLDHAEDTQAAAAIRMLLFTGARSSEITGLKWEWIRGTRAVLPDSKTGPKAIQLPPPARAVLNGLPRKSEYVFPNPTDDAPMKNLGKRWRKLRDLAGLDDVRIHDCRHTFASHAVMSGLDLYTVGRLLGHADVASTERYAHLADEHVRSAAGRISAIVHEAMSGSGKEGES